MANVPRNVPPSILLTGLVAEWDFSEGFQSWVFNRAGSPAYPNPVNCIGAYSEQLLQKADTASTIWTLSGASVTDFYTGTTDPNGNNNASRVVMGGGSNQALYYTVTLAAVQYTLSVWVKSNTGVSQNFRMGNANAPGSDKTATTSWQRFSETFTPSAGSIIVGILNDAAHDPLDVAVYGFQLELGASPTAYLIPECDMQLGKELFPPANVPTWGTTGLTFGASVFTHGILTTPLAFTNITAYAVFKKSNGTDSPGFFEPILTSGSETTPPYGVVIESRDTLNSGIAHDSTGPCFGLGFTGHIVNAANVKCDTGTYHVFCGTYDGTNIKLYFDGTQVEQKAHTISAQAVHRFFNGIFQGNSSATDYFPGTIGMLALYNVAHTVDQVRANTLAMMGAMAYRGAPMSTPTKFIGVEGDSIAAGAGITQAQRWSWLILQSITPTIQQWNDAVGGSTVANCAARAAVFNQALNPATPLNVLIVELGANDMAGGGTAAAFVANLKAYCISQKAAGWQKIAIVPVLNRGDDPTFDARRLAANAAIAADPDFTNGVAADAFITLDPIIMASSAPNDPVLFQADKVHPTAFSNSTYLAPGIQAGVTPLL